MVNQTQRTPVEYADNAMEDELKRLWRPFLTFG